MQLDRVITLSVKIPTPRTVEERLEAEDIIEQQVHEFVKDLRAILNGIKDREDLEVPSIMFRARKSTRDTKKRKTEKVSLKAEYIRKLITYNKQFMPNLNEAEQAKHLSNLYEAGYTNLAQMRVLFDENREKYPFTTWRNVLYNIKNTLTPQEETAKTVSVEERDEIQRRFKERLNARREISDSRTQERPQ